MTHKDGGRLDWSVRYGARSSYTDRVLEDTLEGVADVLARQMPPTAGYEVQRVWLSGSLHGASFRVRRGSFVASVSVQHFQSPARHHEEDDAFALRVVARSSSGSTALMHTTHNSGVRLTAGAAASLGVGALALAVSGNLTAWATAVLMIPAMFAARLCMTLWVANTLGHRPCVRALPEATLTAAQVRDERRWSNVLSDLQTLHETTAERLMLRPFRGLGSTRTPLALGPALRSAG